MQIARKKNPPCNVPPERTKAFLDSADPRGPPEGIQHDNPYCIGVTGNTRASSEGHFEGLSGYCRSREDHLEVSNMISIIASKSRATPKHPPRVISARLVCVFQFLVCFFTSSKDDRLAMPVAFSLSRFLLRSVCDDVHHRSE